MKISLAADVAENIAYKITAGAAGCDDDFLILCVAIRRAMQKAEQTRGLKKIYETEKKARGGVDKGPRSGVRVESNFTGGKKRND